MEKQIYHRYTLPDRYYHSSMTTTNQPGNSTDVAPVFEIGYWPQWPDKVNAKTWGKIEDHRERKPGGIIPPEAAQKATEYWLPGDTWQTPARTMTEIGPLPEGAMLTRPEKPLDEARAEKLAQIDAETSAAILAGFDYFINGETLHFSYDANDQQNFADTANGATLAIMGVPGIPAAVTWNGWRILRDDDGKEFSRSLVRLDLTPEIFFGLYMGGALAHKAARMEEGGRKKAAVEAEMGVA